jgi:hypothetical protein
VATVKSRCTPCKRVMQYRLVNESGLELPAGLSEGICVKCGCWKIVIVDELAADQFYRLTPKQLRKKYAPASTPETSETSETCLEIGGLYVSETPETPETSEALW